MAKNVAKNQYKKIFFISVLFKTWLLQQHAIFLLSIYMLRRVWRDRCLKSLGGIGKRANFSRIKLNN
jgi:hypothetical protein